MSYILDALKKSEKERSLGNVPTLGGSGRDEERGIPLRWFVLTVAVLIAAIVLGGGWMVWSSRYQGGPAAGMVQAPTTAPPAQSRGEPTTTVRPKLQRAEQATAAPPVPVHDLDGAVRSRIPDLRINVLSYSESSSKRFIMIGQEIFKEGEEVAAGVLVEEIRGSDAVFRFEDVRFTLEP